MSGSSNTVAIDGHGLWTEVKDRVPWRRK